MAVLAVSGIAVNIQIATKSLETRADGQLRNDEAIVNLHFAELERRVASFSKLLADAEALTAQLGAPRVARSLTISLLGDIRSNQMRARLYLSEPSPSDRSYDLVRRAFLGIRTTRLSQGPEDDDWLASVESVTPVGEPRRVDRAVVVSFPLTAYTRFASISAPTSRSYFPTAIFFPRFPMPMQRPCGAVSRPTSVPATRPSRSSSPPGSAGGPARRG